jgi:hypothetical protein
MGAIRPLSRPRASMMAESWMIKPGDGGTVDYSVFDWHRAVISQLTTG